mgnify:FL=1
MFKSFISLEIILIFNGLLTWLEMYFKNIDIKVWLGSPFKLSDVYDSCKVKSEL